jgi:hypothetical protein
MDLELLRQKLIAVARAKAPNEAVPYAFEKRIMAGLRPPVAADPWAAWGRGLWRAAGPCVAIMFAMTIWAVFAGQISSSKNSLATDLERTILAPLTNWEEAW